MPVLLPSFAIGLVAILLALAPSEGSTGSPPSAAEGNARPVLLAERRADFREGEDPSRVVADLHARVLREGPRTVFRLVASAVGPRVAPPPGPEGVFGANRIAAEEIESIVEDGRLEVRVTREGRTSSSRVRAGARGEVPVRRLGADGRVEHVAAGGRSRVLALEVEVDLVGEGLFPVEVLVDGRPRVRARLHVRGARARILELEGISAHAVGSAP